VVQMSFKDQIDGVIDAYGTEINLLKKTEVVNDYGDVEYSTTLDRSIKSVPYNYTFLKDTLQKLGVEVSASLYFIVKGDESINNDYIIDYDGSQFKIVSVEKYVLQGVTLAQLIKVSKIE